MGLPSPAEDVPLWQTIQREALAVAAAEPALAAWMHEAVVGQHDLAGTLAQLIAAAVSGSRDEKAATRRMAERVYREHPALIEIATLDLRAPLDRDPACLGPLHVLLHFKGYVALQAYRISHRLWESGRTESARELHARITGALHVSIHPSATIGSGLFIDHGTGITIGEGVVIGEDVSMLQEVTLGGLPEGEAGVPRIGRGACWPPGRRCWATSRSATLPRSAPARWFWRRCRRATRRSACRPGWSAAHPTHGPRRTWTSPCHDPAVKTASLTPEFPLCSIRGSGVRRPQRGQGERGAWPQDAIAPSTCPRHTCGRCGSIRRSSPIPRPIRSACRSCARSSR